MIHYLIAKYVPDLRRNEPDNVGIIVYDGTDAAARFDGEDDNQRIDLRRVRNRVTGTQSYRAWVNYWRAVLTRPGSVDRHLADSAPGDPTVIEHLITTSGDDFYVEQGGTILLDADDLSLRETLDDLFVRLVRQPDPPAPLSLAEKSKEALRVAGAPLDDEARFREQIRVPLDIPGVSVEEEVSYGVMNGQWHYLQAMPFDPDKPRRSRKEASHCVFLFEHAPEVRNSGAIIYDSADIGSQYRLLEMLRRYADTIDVADPQRAAPRLHQRLGL